MAVRAGRWLTVAGLTVALGACSSGQATSTSTLPTLPPSEVPTTPTTSVAPPTLATSAPPLTAPTGGPNTTVLSEPGTSTTAGGRVRYVREPASGPLRLGHRGTRVETLQNQLVALGFALGVDGYFGRGTEDAVRRFQQTQGLSADGIAGPDTQARLAELVPSG
jgi:hypothetical protein